MEFSLINIDPPRDDTLEEDRSEGDYSEETYKAIHTVEQQPILTSIERKRSKKTAECPKCNKRMSKKTLEYSHKCSTPKPEPKQIPTEESLYEYIMQQDRNSREQQRQRKQEQFEKMMHRAF